MIRSATLGLSHRHENPRMYLYIPPGDDEFYRFTLVMIVPFGTLTRMDALRKKLYSSPIKISLHPSPLLYGVDEFLQICKPRRLGTYIYVRTRRPISK